jgi:hypothetical protein
MYLNEYLNRSNVAAARTIHGLEHFICFNRLIVPDTPDFARRRETDEYLFDGTTFDHLEAGQYDDVLPLLRRSRKKTHKNVSFGGLQPPIPRFAKRLAALLNGHGFAAVKPLPYHQNHLYQQSPDVRSPFPFTQK